MRILAALLLVATPAIAAEKPAAPWSAIFVRANGTYDLHEGIKSESVCRETLCYVQWNLSCDDHVKAVAEQKRKDELAEIEKQKRELLYRADHPCTVEKDGSKSCPTSACSAESYDKNGHWNGASSSCSGYFVTSIGQDTSIRVAACFQDKAP